MKINVSFIIICNRDKKNSSISFSENNFIPTFEFTLNDYPDIFNFSREKFKEISNLKAFDIDGSGWVQLQPCGSIVKDNILHIVYGTLIPDSIQIKNCEWKSILDIMKNDSLNENITKQLLYCFNLILR